MISIVIPVFNEEECIKPLFAEIKEAMKTINQKYEVLFVDDGSYDNTLANLKGILANGESNGNLRVIELQNNSGQTPALLAGLANVKGDIIVTMDGDLQNDPNDIPVMLKALTKDYDVICGWRKNRNDNAFKKIPSKFNNFLNKKMNNVDIHDSGCTLRIYRKEAIENIKLFAEGHRYIPAILSHQGFRLGEVETNHRSRTMGKTKYGFKRLFRGFIDLFTLKALHKWSKKPIHLFSFWSALFMLAGFLTFGWVILEKLAFHRFWSYYSDSIPIRSNPLFMISFILSLFSIILLSIGFVAEMLLRSNYDCHKSYTIKEEWS